MLFRKRDRNLGMTAKRGAGPLPAGDAGDLFRVDFDMMVKGNLVERRHGPVRQFGVTVHGATRLVTSGEMVDRDTYRALVAAGAIREKAPEPTHEAGSD